MSELVTVWLPNGWACKVEKKDVAEYCEKGFSTEAPKAVEVEKKPEVKIQVPVEVVPEVKAAAVEPKRKAKRY